MKKLLVFILLLNSVLLFGQSSDATLTTQANVIRNETSPGGNTKERVADMFQGLIDSKFSSFENTLQFVPVSSPTYQEGKVFYDSDNDCVSYYDDISGTSVQIAYEGLIRARNNTGVTITNGQAVYISGATGQNPTISLAIANSEATSDLIGLATHDIANNTVGKVVVFGEANDLNTSGFSVEDHLYLSSSTPGALVNVPPASPNFVTFVGVVTNSNPTSGKIFVNPGIHLDNNNSLGTSQNSSPTQNAVKTYVDGRTTLSSQQVGFGSGTSIIGSSNFTWDDTNWNLTAAEGTVSMSGTNNIQLIGDGTVGFGGGQMEGSHNFSACEDCIFDSPVDNSLVNSAAFGWQNTIGDGSGNFSGNAGITYGANNFNFGRVCLVGGSGSETIYGINTGAIAIAWGTAGSHSGITVKAVGGSGNISKNTSSQHPYYGTRGINSFILAGTDHHIPDNADRVVVIGGTGIVADSAITDQVYVPTLNIETEPTNNDTINQILVREFSTGRVHYRNASSIGISGTYTPTLTNVANLDGSTAFQCQYMRVGNVVTVSGKVSVDPTLTSTSTQLGISLPIASAIAAEEDCGGAASAPGIAAQGAAILGDASNDRAQLQFISGDITDQPMFFTFMYEVL